MSNLVRESKRLGFYRPEFLDHVETYEDLRIWSLGPREVKAAGTRFLPPLRSMELDGMERSTDKGAIDYSRYLRRAIVPETFQRAIERIQGTLHDHNSEFSGAEGFNQNLQAFYETLTNEVVLTGRAGVLLDIAEDGGFKFLLYKAESIVAWANNFYILDESHYEQDGFSWVEKRQFRLLDLRSGIYKSGTFVENPEEAELKPILLRGEPLTKIPFLIIGSSDVNDEIGPKPLEKLLELSLAIYSAEADHQRALHLQAQDTLVISNGMQTDEKVRIGAGSIINLDPGGKAEFIGVSSAGLQAQQKKLEFLYDRASHLTGELLKIAAFPSGEALRARQDENGSTLNQIASTCEQGLNLLATYFGIELGFSANRRFSLIDISAGEVLSLVNAKKLGAPISSTTLHRLLKLSGYTDEEADSEIAKAETEMNAMLAKEQATALANRSAA